MDYISKQDQANRLNDPKKYETVKQMLAERGVTLNDIAQLTLDLQKPYLPHIDLDLCLVHVNKVLLKREVQHAILVGIELDVLAEKDMLSEPLSTLVKSDHGLFGVDEILALSIVNVYGSIGLTNFGYVDKLKPGIMGELDNDGKKEGRCNTFLDDIVGAIASAAASSIAHRYTI